MLISLLKCKLHRASVTAAQVDYPGSIGISRELIAAAGLRQWERVLVANLRDGARFETYVIPEDAPGRIVLNGAAAHLGRVGDRVIVMAFAEMTPEEAEMHQPRVVVLDEQNRIAP